MLNILHSRKFLNPATLVKFINKNKIKQEQIVSIVREEPNPKIKSKHENVGRHVVYFYHSGRLKYDLGSYLPHTLIHKVKGDRVSFYYDSDEIWLFPTILKNDIPLQEFNELLEELNG